MLVDARSCGYQSGYQVAILDSSSGFPYDHVLFEVFAVTGSPSMGPVIGDIRMEHTGGPPTREPRATREVERRLWFGDLISGDLTREPSKIDGR